MAATLPRRGVLRLGLAVSLTPDALRRALAESAGEAMEFSQSASATAVGAATFAHLGEAVASLGRAYPLEAPAGLFLVARAYRAQVQRLIGAPCTLSQKRELYVYAAWLSEALAWLSEDLGAPLAAHAWAVDCLEHAREAGHGDLCGWAAGAMASVALTTRQAARAIEAAMAGLAWVPAAHPLGVWLRLKAARGHAMLGQRDACHALIGEAERGYARIPAGSPVCDGAAGQAHHFAVAADPASCFVRPGDFGKAAGYARRALEVQQSASPAERSLSKDASARVGLALAVAGLGDPGEAAELGCQALAAGPRLTAVVMSHARDLDAVLADRYPGQADAARFRARYADAVAGRREIAR